jgi:hypothetical protein
MGSDKVIDELPAAFLSVLTEEERQISFGNAKFDVTPECDILKFRRVSRDPLDERGLLRNARAADPPEQREHEVSALAEHGIGNPARFDSSERTGFESDMDILLGR